MVAYFDFLGPRGEVVWYGGGVPVGECSPVTAFDTEYKSHEREVRNRTNCPAA
jgi:hypothetical protein